MGDVLALVAGLRLEDGSTWGERAEPWQVEDMRAVVDPAGPRWHFCSRARGMSKTTDVAAAGLGLLVEEAPARSRSYVVAVDQDQAALVHDALAGLVARTPELAGAVKVEVRRVTALATGATLEVLASDAASAFGLRPWFFVADELAAWPSTPGHRRLWSAVVSSLPKVAGSRLVVCTTAGSPSHWSHDVWLRALSSEHWRASAVAGPCPWWSPADIEAARADLIDFEFRRLVLNEWTEGEDQLTSAAAVAAAVVHSGPLAPLRGVSYVVALDVGLKRDATALVVAHAERTETGPRIVVDRLHRWKGTRTSPVDLTEVEAAAFHLSRSYNRAPLVFDVHQAAHLSQNLRARGVRTEEFVFSVPNINRLARTLYTLLRDHRLAIPDDEDLCRELAAVRLVETSPGMFRVDHHRGAHDDQAIAVGMASAWLEAKGAYRPARLVSAAGQVVGTPASPRRRRLGAQMISAESIVERRRRDFPTYEPRPPGLGW